MADFELQKLGQLERIDNLAGLTFGERVKFLRKEKGLSQQALADLAGISQNAVQKIESGGDTSSVVELAKALDVSPAFLKLGDGERISYGASLRPIRLWDHEDELTGEEYVFLPSINVRLSAGDGTQMWHVEDKGQRQAFTQKWADRIGIKPDCAATMVVSGSSMEPRYQDGDSVVVDYCQNTSILDGHVYAICLEGEVFIKRLFKEVGGAVRVVSDNPDKNRHPDKLVAIEYNDRLKIIGKVVALCGAAT